MARSTYKPLTALPQILLVGMPRSGTSWVSKIFDSHPEVVYFHEPDSSIMLDFLDLIDDRRLDPDAIARVQEVVSSFWTLQKENVTGSLPIFPKSYMTRTQHLRYVTSNTLSKYSSRLFGKPMLAPSRSIGGASVLVWKSIESLGRVDQLKQALGDKLKVVHIVRHPAGQVYSTLSGEERSHFGNYRAGEDLDLFKKILASDTAQRLGYSIKHWNETSPAQRLAQKWAVYNDHALESDACDFVLNYDDLCKSPLTVAESVFDAVGIDLTAEAKAFIANSTSTDVARYYSVYKNPLLSSSKWKSGLGEKARTLIHQTLEGSKAYALFETAI